MDRFEVLLWSLRSSNHLFIANVMGLNYSRASDM